MQNPTLQKPPGYKDPTLPPSIPKPPQKKPQIPPALRRPGKSSRRNRSCCCRLFCFLFLLLIILIILLAAFSTFIYLWFHPHPPSFRVESIDLSIFNISSRSDGTYLDAAATIKIRAENSNARLGLSCRGSEGKVWAEDEDGGVDLGEGLVAGFVLGRKNSTVVRVRVRVKGALVDDSVGVRLRRRYGSRELGFGVEMRMKVGFVVGGKFTPKFPIRVKCGGVSLREVGRMRPLPKCDIDLFNGEFLD